MHVFEISSLVELVRVKRLGACVIIRQMRNMHVRVAWPGCIAVWRRPNRVAGSKVVTCGLYYRLVDSLVDQEAVVHAWVKVVA